MRSFARSGSPGAGYWTSKSARGNPPKSWIVRGVETAVTPVPSVYQCAEIATIARGRGSEAPSAFQSSVHLFVTSAFIGLPWPMKSAGIRSVTKASCRELGR